MKYGAIKLFIFLAIVYVGYYLPISQMELGNWVQTATTICILSVVYVVGGFFIWVIWVVIKSLFK